LQCVMEILISAKRGLKQFTVPCIGVLILLNLFIYSIYVTVNWKAAEEISSHPEKDNIGTLFLVRTYSGHLDSKDIFNLQTLLISLKSLENPNWIALLVCTDVNPINFEQYTKQDSRIRAYPHCAKVPYDPWNAGYDTTDEVLEYLENNGFSATSLVITNGDNYYSPNFLNELPSPDTVDMVAVDYWSRYKRGMEPLNMSSTICHEAVIRCGMVDLGGVILNYQRFQSEHRRFMVFGAVNSQDGFMFTLLVHHGWRMKYVRNCLFSHSPNPYMCNKLGGVWWDSSISGKELGESCLNSEQVEKKESQFPVIKLVSSTGIRYMTVPEPLRSQRQQISLAEQSVFLAKFMARIKSVRNETCMALKRSGYELDPKSYIYHNSDLAGKLKNVKEVKRHFWNFGCYESRPIANVSESYYLPITVAKP
jgi:hypothetical protein